MDVSVALSASSVDSVCFESLAISGDKIDVDDAMAAVLSLRQQRRLL